MLNVCARVAAVPHPASVSAAPAAPAVVSKGNVVPLGSRQAALGQLAERQVALAAAGAGAGTLTQAEAEAERAAEALQAEIMSGGGGPLDVLEGEGRGTFREMYQLQEEQRLRAPKGGVVRIDAEGGGWGEFDQLQEKGNTPSAPSRGGGDYDPWRTPLDLAGAGADAPARRGGVDSGSRGGRTDDPRGADLEKVEQSLVAEAGGLQNRLRAANQAMFAWVEQVCEFRLRRGGFRLGRGGFRLGRGGFRLNRGGFRLNRGGFRLNRGGFRLRRGGFRLHRGGFRDQPCDVRVGGAGVEPGAGRHRR
eukprot:1194264-Prorocentrum_minimum.AAC.1